MNQDYRIFIACIIENQFWKKEIDIIECLGRKTNLI